MKTINILYIIGVVVLLLISSCTNNQTVRNKYTVSLINDSLTMTSSSKGVDSVCILRITDREIPLDKVIRNTYNVIIEMNFTEKLSLNIIDLLKKDLLNEYNIALQLIEKGDIGFIVKINNEYDTVLYVNPSLEKNISHNGLIAHIVNGNCAKLEEKKIENDQIAYIKNWLYNVNRPMSDSTIIKMAKIVTELRKTTEKEYVTFDEIPIIKNFSGLKYNISTNMKADFYYLFATDKEEELDGFIKEVVISGYEMAETNISKPLSCFRENGKGGILCIFLVGINKDWSKQIVPVGMIAIDNFYPRVNSRDPSENKSDNQKNRSYFYIPVSIKIDSIKSKILIPEKAPELTGFLTIGTNYFRGNHANFEFDFAGDIESISIKREIHRSYNRLFLRPETKVINLTNKVSPYHLTYELDLGIGDNYIPITVTDKRGNKTEYSYKISMARAEDNNSQINIDNNINIWN